MDWFMDMISPKFTINRLLKEYKDPLKTECSIDSTQILRFEGLKDGYIVYNITPPFQHNGEEYLFGRVEDINDTETGSEVWLFKRRGMVWDAAGLKIPNLEDPFYTFINNEIIFGGVRVNLHSPSCKITYFTVFWRLKNWDELNLLSDPFLIGPAEHKDIRLVELKKGIGVFTRPQGVIGGKGIICFTKINTVDELSEELILSAKPIDDFKYLFDKKTVWGGVNDAYRLGDSNKLMVIGHLAYATNLNGKITEDGEIRHYHGFSFIFDTETREVNSPKIILLRKDLPHTKVKKYPNKHKDDLKDVVFIGGSRLSDRPGLIKIYGGASDAAGFYTVIEDPVYAKIMS